MGQPQIKTDIEARVQDTGDTMTGSLMIQKDSWPQFILKSKIANYFSVDEINNSGGYVLSTRTNDTTNGANGTYLTIHPQNSTNLLTLGKNVDGIYTEYNILHTGNYKNILYNQQEEIGTGQNSQHDFNENRLGLIQVVWGGYIQNSPWEQNSNHFGTMLQIGNNVSYQHQIIFDNFNDTIYYRGRQHGEWRNWYQILTSNNIANLSSKDALLLRPTDNLSNTIYQQSSWTANVAANNGIIVWRERFINSSLGTDSGDIIFWLNGSTTLNITIDGHFYQNADKLVLDSANFSNYAATKSHTHPITQITWAGTQNLATTGANTEWSIDMAGDATNSYFHIWSGIKSASCMQFENNTGICRAPFGVYGGVWNDYAEYRTYPKEEIPYGRCVVEVGDDTMELADGRLIPGAAICSDTFGFAIGETDECNMPIAVSGRVLAYPYEGREEFARNIGRPVCSGPNGTVSIMSDEEYKEKGYCCVGTISAIPNYEVWGTGNVNVDGRVWISV